MTSEDAVIPAPQESRSWGVRSRWRKLRERLTPRLAAAVVIWRVEARFALPLALVLIAAIGRWPAALTMGAIMAVPSALLLFLLDGEQATNEMRDWLRDRRFVKRYLLPIAEREDRTGAVQRAVSLPITIMFMGPFFRAITYHLFRVPRVPAYMLSMLGSIPHSLLWTGLVVGGLYAIAFEPAVDWLWSAALEPAFSASFDAAAAVVTAFI